MSESSQSTDSSSQSPSLLSNLRHFRIQRPSKLKNDISSPEKNSAASANSQISPLHIPQFRGLANRIIDSDSENEKSPNKSSLDGQLLTKLRERFSKLQPVIVERCLIQCRNNEENTSKMLTDMETKSIIKPETNGLSNLKRIRQDSHDSSSQELHVKKKTKRVKNREENYGSGDSDNDEGYDNKEKRVFDSDEDSDVEISDMMTTDQKQVYDFLNKATLTELLTMQKCSQKKAEAIIEQRPFDGWKDLVKKFQEGKNLSTDLLNSAQEILFTRDVVYQLMQKCSKLAVEIERAVAVGATNVKTQPKLLNPNMKLTGYQLIGLNWLIVLHFRGVNGILADEMGLGKTIQVIAFLAHLQECRQGSQFGPHVIVVPASTLDNWKKELELWCPTLRVLLYYGSAEERKVMRVKISQQGVDDIDVLLTTYNLVSSTPEERKMFKVLPFDYVVFDEAHMLKNINTQRFENLMRINAKHRILLTGTPLQNNLLELMSLLTFVMPNMFAKKKHYLKCLFTRNKTKLFQTTTEELPVRFEQEQITRAREIMKPFVLRRMKKDVLKDLPMKTEQVMLCAMTNTQNNKYQQLISTYKRNAKNVLGCEGEEISGMTMVMHLRKLSNHPLLLRELYDNNKIADMARLLVQDISYPEDNIDYVTSDLSVLSDFQLHSLSKRFQSISHFKLEDNEILQSGKFQQLNILLGQLQTDGHRVLMFSQFVIMLDVIEEYLNIRGYKFIRLDGSTPVTARQELIDMYNNDPSIFIFILSTRAGGLGINLTAADTVIIHDIDFNPYNDKQAEDRCHRVGQTKPVRVIRLLSKDSIDEGIHQVALDKLSLGRELSNEEENEQAETKSIVRLLKQALGLESSTSPNKTIHKKL